MRWSLILSTSLTVLSTFSTALVIPTSESLVDLERRAGGANLKASSRNNYRDYENHDSAYEFDHTGAVTREKFSLSHGKRMMTMPKTDAGKSIPLNSYLSGPLSLTILSFYSIVEDQMQYKHLERHGLRPGLKYRYGFYF